MHVQVYLRLDPLTLARPDFAMPALEHLLAKGSVTKNTEVFEAALCQTFGVEKQLDWPAAALSWLGEGNAPGDYFWLYADPVNLQLQRDHFTLNLPAPVPLTSAESGALSASLNQHFNENGLMFCVAVSGRWYLRLAYPVAVTTRFPSEAAGRDVRNFLPQGATGEKWHGVLNEIQMLLHEHPVNRMREEQGLPVINSLWFSGAGLVPLLAHVPPRTVLANDSLAKGLSHWAGRDALPLSPHFALSDAEYQDVLLVLDDAQQANAQWLASLLAALRRRDVKRLTIDIFIQDRHVHAALKPRDLWRFWRKPEPLESYFSW